jgi:hypothetical protein
MMKQQSASIYIRKEDQKTVQILKELTREPIAQIMHEFLEAIQKVLNSIPNETYRLTVMSIADLKSKPKRTVFLIAPIFAESLDFSPTNLSESVDQTLADIEIQKDIEKKVLKNE